jgi:hypothetical protein
MRRPFLTIDVNWCSTSPYSPEATSITGDEIESDVVDLIILKKSLTVEVIFVTKIGRIVIAGAVQVDDL